jgi:hypothetical protein
VTTLNISTAHTDIMWQSIDSSMWTVIESNLGIIVACMPALRRPIAMFFPLLLGKMGRSTPHGSKKYPNAHHHTPHSATFRLEKTKDQSQYSKASSRLGRGWRHQDEMDPTADEAHQEESIENVSDSDRRSADHILAVKEANGHRRGGNSITKTLEVQVETGFHDGGRNRTYFPR